MRELTLKFVMMTTIFLQVNDSVQLDLATNKVQDIIKFEVRGEQII